VNQAATDEIVLSNGDSVQVRQRLTAREEAELSRNLIQLKYDVKTGEANVEVGEWYLQQLVIVKAYLLGWDFRDDEGELQAYRPELVLQLDGDTVSEIAKAIDACQAKRKELLEKKESMT